MKNLYTIFVLVCALASTACKSTPDKATADPPKDSANVALSEGYALLYKVLSDQSGVDRLFVFRSASGPTKQLVQSIAQTCRDGKQHLDQRQETLKAEGIGFDARGLPVIEAESRTILASRSSSQLLTGGRFEVNLLLTQSEATRYIAALAKALADHDGNEKRSQWLNDLSQQMFELQDQVAERLTVAEAADGGS